MTVHRATCLAIAAALAAALVAGCGGDTRRGEDQSTASETAASATAPATTPGPGAPAGHAVTAKVTDPARRAYVARVDSICGHLDRERRAQQERVAGTIDPHEAMVAYDDSISLGWRELRRIEAIPTPPGDRALLRHNVFDVIRSQLRMRTRMSRALAAMDIPRLQAMRTQVDDMSRAMSGFARGYGFRVCGED
ncbi:MAG: hypothetical protein U0R26_07735 [Solirubrobacterales bacterium]